MCCLKCFNGLAHLAGRISFRPDSPDQGYDVNNGLGGCTELFLLNMKLLLTSFCNQVNFNSMFSVPANSEHINESSLLKKASAGDRIAFSTLYTHYFPRLYRFVFFINQSHEDTEEILQDVFLKIWDKKESLPRIRSFEDYIFRMAKEQAV